MAKQQRENPKTKPWSYALLDPFLRILNPASKARCRIWCFKIIVSKFYIFKVYAYQNIMNLMRDERVTKWSSSVNFNWRSWQKCKLQSVNLSDAVCTEFAVQIYTKQPYLSICWILEFISALFNNHTVIVQNLAFNHFQKLAVFSGEYWMQICITCSKLFRRKRRNIKRAFFVWKPRQNITTVLTTEATLLEFMIQVILYRLVYGVQGCICNENIFYWFATHYTGQFAITNIAGQE